MPAIQPVAVRDVWVSCDRWPNAKDLGTWARDVFRIAGARTPEERAVALYRWTLITMMRGPAVLEGPRGIEAYTQDTLKYLAVHGMHYCDGLARLMVNAWAAAGAGRARKVVIFNLGHTIAELEYRDADQPKAGLRWHVFDPQHGWYVRSRDGGHVASLAEIDADPALLQSPADPPRPFFFARGTQERWTDREAATHRPVHGRAPAPQHAMRIDLRRGESWTAHWSPGAAYWPYASGPEPKPPGVTWPETDSLGERMTDTFLGEHCPPYLFKGPDGKPRRMQGHCEFRYALPFTRDGWRDGAVSAEGVAAEKKPSFASATLHAARLSEVGALIYEVRTPYLITDARIEAVARTGADPLDMLAFYVSLDGGSSWQRVWGNPFAQKGRLVTRPRRVRADFGAAAYTAGAFSVVGRYGYHVRIDFLARREVGDVGLDEFVLTTECLCNMMALPMLLPGRNVVALQSASAPRGAKVRVDYAWQEKGRSRWQASKTLPAAGGEFTVRIGATRPADVRMKSVRIEIV